MKTMNRILISLTMSLFFLSNTAVANNYNPTFEVDGNKLYVSIDQVSEQTVVWVKDANGFTWIEEKVVAKGTFKKVFNLEKLPEGAYNLIIKSAYKETVQPIIISNSAMMMDESKRAEYFHPNLSKKWTKMNLSLQNPTQSEVRVTVINMKGIKVFNDTVRETIIDKNYNFRFLPSGNYTVVVDNGHDVVTQFINL
jgi:hypothetical protein